MTTYEIQCPHCGGALVVPANNSDELQEFWKEHQESGLDFYCPGCRNSFKGLCEQPRHSEDVWENVVDVNGARFNAAQKRLNKLFELARGYNYLHDESECNQMRSEKGKGDVKIICTNGLPADQSEVEEARRFALVAKTHGHDWTLEEAFRNWEAHSSDYGAGWLTMPKSDEGLWVEWKGYVKRMEENDHD